MDREPYALTLGEAADILRVSPRTIHRMIAGGALTSAKIGGRRLIPTRVVHQLIDDHTTTRSAAAS